MCWIKTGQYLDRYPVLWFLATLFKRKDSRRRGTKRDLYEGRPRVPCIVCSPGVGKPGSVCEGLVSQVDIMATLAAAIGAALPANTAHDRYNLSNDLAQKINLYAHEPDKVTELTKPLPTVAP